MVGDVTTSGAAVAEFTFFLLSRRNRREKKPPVDSGDGADFDAGDTTEVGVAGADDGAEVGVGDVGTPIGDVGDVGDDGDGVVVRPPIRDVRASQPATNTSK